MFFIRAQGSKCWGKWGSGIKITARKQGSMGPGYTMLRPCMYTQALACVQTSPFFFVAKRKGNRRPPHEGFSALNRVPMEAYIIHVFYYYVESLFQAFGQWSAAPRKRARKTPYSTPLLFLSAHISLRYLHDLNAWNRLLCRPRAIALLSLEPCAASENVKLRKLMVKRMSDFFARALALVSRLRRWLLTRVLDRL